MQEDELSIKAPEGTKNQDENDVLIRVMPKEYFGKKASVSTPPAPVKPKSAPVPLPPPKPVPEAAQSVAKKVPVRKSSNKFTYILIGSGIFLLTILLGGGYVFLFANPFDSSQEPEIVVEQPDPITEPDPVNVAPPEILPGKDTDSDGLSDREEALYGTDFRNPDTDGDTFLDGNEVFHGYNPLSSPPSTMLDAGMVDELIPSSGLYSVWYPRVWRTQEENGTTVVSTSTSAQFVLHELQDVTEIEALLLSHDPDVDHTLMPETMTKQGYVMRYTENKLWAFVEIGSDVVAIEYRLENERYIDFLGTFQMMIHSFKANSSNPVMEVDIEEEEIEETQEELL